MANMVEIGVFIRERRKALRLSLEGLAQRVGVSKNTAWNWEHAKYKSIDSEHLQRLATALKVPTTSLVPDAPGELVDKDAPHIAVVQEYLDGPRGRSIKPWVAEQLLDGSCFESIQQLGGEISWEDVESMRQLLERRAPEDDSSQGIFRSNVQNKA